jgi:hypothetical protein
VDENSRTVLQWYWEQSTLASKIHSTLASGSFLLVNIVGRSGWGKTSYAYYALKTGIIRYLCTDAGKTGIDDCVAYIERNHGELCMCKYCEEPDGLDREYHWAYFTGFRDLGKFLMNAEELLTKGSRRKILFFDDLISSTTYALGGKWRMMYMGIRDIVRVARLGASVIITTAISPSLVPKFFKEGSEYIGVRKYGRLYLYQRFIKHPEPNKDGTYTTVLHLAYEDSIPIKPLFGLPTWLENDINERKKQLIIDISRMARELEEDNED